MSEKTYNINDENNKSFKLTIKTNADSLDFKLEGDSNEKYEIKNISMDELKKKNKIYKQFDNVQKVSEVIDKKLDNKNFVLKTKQCVLKFKHTNEFDEEEFISYEIPLIGGVSAEPQKDESEELKKLKKQNEDLKFQLEKLTGIKADSKPIAYMKRGSNYTIGASISHPGMLIDGKIPNQYIPLKRADTSSYKDPVYKISCEGAYKGTEGDFFTRFDECVQKKKNLKNTIEDLQKRASDAKAIFDKSVNKLFAGDPSAEERMKILDHMWIILRLYHESREVEHYDDKFEDEVNEKKIQFSADEKKKYDEGMVMLRKTFQFQLAQTYKKTNDTLRDLIKNFFTDKNLRHFKENEIKAITEYKEKLMFVSN